MKPIILLVEDEPDLLQVVVMAIERQFSDYSVVSAANAEEATAALDTIRTDGSNLALAMVDHHLSGPGHTGGEDIMGGAILDRIHAEHPQTPRFLFTGQASHTVERRAKDGGVRVLWKPIRLAALLLEIQNALKPKA